MKLRDLFEIYLIMKEPVIVDEHLEYLLYGEDLKKDELQRDLPEISHYSDYEIAGIETLKEGDVIEFVPSFDGLPLRFVVLKGGKGDFETLELVPLSEFYQFATPSDVLTKIEPPEGFPFLEPHGKVYIAQTDLFITVPFKLFDVAVPKEMTVLKIGKVSPRTVERIKRVLEGEEKGDGHMSGGIKERFKEEEAKRYSLIQSVLMREIEKFAEINKALKELNKGQSEKIEMPSPGLGVMGLTATPKGFLDFISSIARAMASTQEPIADIKRHFRWAYDKKEQLLKIKITDKNLIGKRGRILLKTGKGKKELVLYDGILKEEISIPIEREAFNGFEFQKGLDVQSLQRGGD